MQNVSLGFFYAIENFYDRISREIILYEPTVYDGAKLVLLLHVI